MKISFRIPALFMLLGLVLSACQATHDAGDTAPPLLLISIDGFRHDYMQKAELPVLEQLTAEGLKADSLQLVFPTKTFAAHYSTATGLYAENSGVVANSMWDPKRKSRFSMGNRDAVGDGYWYDGEPIWNTVEKAGKIAATYFWPGSEAQIGGIRPSIWKPYAGDTPHDMRVDQVLEWLALPEDQRPAFLTLYFSAVDSAGHRHGPDHPAIVEAMFEVDRALGRLVEGLKQLGLYNEMHILITSDHGMQTIDLDRYILLDDFLDLSRANVSDWGPAAQIWTVDGGPSADELLAAIDIGHPGIRRAWKKGNAPARFHFDDHQRVPDLTVEAELGWMISNKAYYAGMQRGLLNGMHGWDPAWHRMHGVFIAHGPAFVPGDRLPAVRSVDLYSLMARLMDVPPADTDGSLAAFALMLESEQPVSVSEQHWLCGEDPVVARVSRDLAALHYQQKVFALPRVESASGVHYVDSGVEFLTSDGVASIAIDGQQFDDCQRVSPREGK